MHLFVKTLCDHTEAGCSLAAMPNFIVGALDCSEATAPDSTVAARTLSNPLWQLLAKQ